MQKILATPAAKRIAKELNVTLSQVVPAAPDRFIRVKDVRAALNNIGTIDKGYSQKIRMTPLAKKMAELHNIRESELLENSGDRITKSHILEVLRKRSENPTCSAGPADCTALGSEQIIPLKGMRKVIADTMMQSLLTQAQTTVFSDFDTTELLQLHKNLKDSFLERYGVKLTLTHLFIRLIGSLHW